MIRGLKLFLLAVTISIVSVLYLDAAEPVTVYYSDEGKFTVPLGKSYNYSDVYVSRVIDGDTIKLENGQMVRYIGIDTPETRRREGEVWVYKPDVYGEEATEFNRRLVEGKLVRLEFDVEKKDKYSRLLAYCFVGDTFVNAKILEEGYGLLYTFSPNVKYVDMLVKLQQEARQNNRGLWGVRPVISAKAARSYVDKIATVEGKVSSIRQSGRVAVLSFGQSGFKVAIFKEDFPAFMSSGVSIPKYYKGRTVRVTGKVKIYRNDAEIIVRHPSAIEIIY